MPAVFFAFSLLRDFSSPHLLLIDGSYSSSPFLLDLRLLELFSFTFCNRSLPPRHACQNFLVHAASPLTRFPSAISRPHFMEPLLNLMTLPFPSFTLYVPVDGLHGLSPRPGVIFLFQLRFPRVFLPETWSYSFSN